MNCRNLDHFVFFCDMENNGNAIFLQSIRKWQGVEIVEDYSDTGSWSQLVGRDAKI